MPPSRRAAALALAVVLLAACAHTRPATVPRSATVAASHDRQDWITERLRSLRMAGAADAAATDAARQELDRAGVDWRSFLTPIRGSTAGTPKFFSEPLKNHTLRQIAQKLNLVRDVRQILRLPDRANDLAADGNVLDSAFFTNRDVGALAVDEVVAEAEAQAPHGLIRIVEPKTEGTSEGFIGKDERDDLFIFILDPPEFPEMSTAAEVIGSTILRTAGYYVPYPTIVTLNRLGLEPQPEVGGLTVSDIERYRGRRAVATKMIREGYRGPWTYSVFRDRREIRALRVFAAWLNNPDQVDHNTLVELFDEDAGLLRYYVIDFSGALGASSARVKDPWDGYINNKFDFHHGVTWPLRLIRSALGYPPPWDEDQPVVSRAVGRFDANLRPRHWKPYYPNLAYEDMDDEDAAWAARIVGAFSDELLDAIVGLAKYSNPSDAAYVAKTLQERRDIIVRTYLD